MQPAPRDLALIIVLFFILWVVLDRSAALLGSTRGEAGTLVCAIVLAVAMVIEVLAYGKDNRDAVRFLGFVRPDPWWLVATVVLCGALLAFFPAYGAATGTPVTLVDNWPLLAVGIAAQGGLAEEVVFRGFLFRHIRQRTTFWRAALISAVPFIAVHLLLFASLDFPIALAALLVSVSLSFPLAKLYERGGFSIWLPALLHFVVQGAIKLVVVPDAAMTQMALYWMAISALAPWLVFLMPERKQA
jgi:membrane protease YdiL (CAAX protease family)